MIVKPWFRRGQRWRVGCEGRISVIKRRHGLRRCRYHGTGGMARWVGLGVIADNLIKIASFVKCASCSVAAQNEMNRSITFVPAKRWSCGAAQRHFFTGQ